MQLPIHPKKQGNRKSSGGGGWSQAGFSLPGKWGAPNGNPPSKLSPTKFVSCYYTMKTSFLLVVIDPVPFFILTSYSL